MPRQKATYHLGKICSVLMLTMLLGWLTVSLPYVYQAKQQSQQTKKVVADLGSSEEETAGSLGGSTEEKTSGNTLSEFLHEQESLAELATLLISHAPDASDDTYLAFHGELLVPPPEHQT